MPRSFKIFISSTWESAALTEMRQELTEELRLLGHHPLMMDRDGALPVAPAPAIRFSVEDCDVLVGIYGSRYGSLRPGGSESFTEYEFDVATQSRKRRLCYFFEEGAGHPNPEPEEKQEAQRRFKAKIDRQLVRADFSRLSPGAEATGWVPLKNQIVRDIRKLEGGAPLGVTHAEVRDAWLRYWAGPTRRESSQLRELWEHLAAWKQREEEGLGSSWQPLMPLWERFLQAPGWHDVVGHQLRAIRQAASSLGLAALARSCAAIALHRNCNELSESLRPLVSRQELEQLNRFIESKERARSSARLRAVSRSLEELLQTARQLRRDLLGLQRQLESPTYGRCFLVAGKQGAGKTHFVESLLAELGANEEAPLVLPVSIGGPIERLLPSIEESLRAHTGVAWRSLEEFDRFLGDEYEPEASPSPAPASRLIIAIDDLHTWIREQPGLLDALLSLVKDHTRLRRVDWLITVQSSHLEKLITGPLANDWQQYSFLSRLAPPASAAADPWLTHAWSVQAPHDAPPHVGGWLSLDELNTRARVGLQILHAQLQAKARGATMDQLWFLDEIREGRIQQVPRLLHEPFIAWTALSLADLQLRDLLNVSFIEFVEAFWNRYQASLERLLEERKKSINPDVPARELLEGAVRLTASVMARAGSLELARPQLEKRIAEAALDQHSLEDRALVKQTLEVLIQANLLEQSTATSREQASLPVDRVRLRTDTFWELQLARQLWLSPELAEGDAREALHYLRGWFDKVQAEDVREGTFGFLLLLLSRHAELPGTPWQELTAALWHFDTAPEYRAAAWFAAPRAAPDLQTRLAREGGNKPGEMESIRELFAFMYFVCEADPRALDTPQRLAALKPLLASIGKAGLAAYYRYIVECILGREGKIRQVLIALRHLSGCEVLDAWQPGFTETLADGVVAALVRLAGGDAEQALGILLGYLQSSREPMVTRYKPKRAKGDWRRYFLLEWVLNRFCIWLVMSRRLAGYILLEQRQWFRPHELGLGTELGEELDREANIALGHWYASSSSRHEKNTFEQYISQLGQSPLYQDVRRASNILSHCGYAVGQETGKLHDLYRRIEEKRKHMRRPGGRSRRPPRRHGR